MKPVLFYSTTPTGDVDWKSPSEAPQQPHIVQLAACLVDTDTWSMISGLDVIIRPDGWEIPDEAAKAHGITTLRAAQFGVGEPVAINLLLDLWGCAEHRVGHGEQFHNRVIRIAIKRHLAHLGAEECDRLADLWKAGAAECTARLATPLCALAPTEAMRRAGRNHFKTPTLSEAYTHFFGTAFDGAHSANADVQACMQVYRAIRELKERLAARPAANEASSDPAAA